MASKCSTNSQAHRFLERHGWRFLYSTPKGFCDLKRWEHPVHGQDWQGAAIKLQQRINKEKK